MLSMDGITFFKEACKSLSIPENLFLFKFSKNPQRSPLTIRRRNVKITSSLQFSTASSITSILLGIWLIIFLVVDILLTKKTH